MGAVTSDLEVTEAPERGAFVLRVDGVEAGHVDVRRREAPPAIVLLHTEVEPAYGGQGLGGRLVRAVFDAARAEGVGLVPLCEYAQGWVGKHPEYLGDVPEHDRTELGLDGPHREEAS
jgi:uncharacterized protein